jgi:hypothetical protein
VVVVVAVVMLKLALTLVLVLSKQVPLADLVVVHLPAAAPVVLARQDKVIMVAKLPAVVLVYIVVVVVAVPELMEPVIFLAKLEQVASDCSHQ